MWGSQVNGWGLGFRVHGCAARDKHLLQRRVLGYLVPRQANMWTRVSHINPGVMKPNKEGISLLRAYASAFFKDSLLQLAAILRFCVLLQSSQISVCTI